VIAVATGMACLHGVSLLPGFRDWAATDLLHGWSPVIVAVIAIVVAIVFVVAAPFRSGFGIVPLGLGFLSGGAFWWLGFALLQADLLSRNDQYFAVLAAMILSVLLGKAVFGPWLTLTLARWELRRVPRGHGLLRWARGIMLGPDRGHLCRDGHRWWHWLFQAYNSARCSLLIGPSRSCSIEKAIEEGVDRESRELRRLVDEEKSEQLRASSTIDDQASRTADAGAAYLEFVAILDEAALGYQISEAAWMQRFLVVWDLIRFAEGRVQMELGPARAELLTGVERLSNRTLILSEAARASRCKDLKPALIDRVSEKMAGESSLSDQVAAVLVVDLLVDLKYATWAIGLLDEMLFVSEWLRPTLERIRMQAEQQILRHELSLEKSDIFARLAQCERAAVIADAPRCIRIIGEASASWRDMTVVPSRRGTLGLPSIPRPRFDPGPGRGLATAALVAIAIFAAIAWTSWSPIGPAYKTLADLHRPIDYHEHPLTSGAINPKDQNLLVTSLGAGLHNIDTHTFRIRTETPDNGGPSTKFLTDVAVSEAGLVAVVTADDAQGTASGLDVRGPNGWHKLIAPSGVSGLRANDISFVGAIGDDKVLLVGTRLLRYRTAQRELTELTCDDQGLLGNGQIIAVASSPTEPEKIWVAIGKQNQPTRVLELLLRDEKRYSAKDITSKAMSAESVKHLAIGKDRLWASTATGRLYQYDGARWSLRIDGDTGLDLAAIRHAIVSVGESPALWLTERDVGGDVRAIRARILPSKGVLPNGPWRRSELGQGNVPRSVDLRLGQHDGTPAAWFDANRKEHVLAIPGQDGGLWCFRASLNLPESIDRATLAVEHIPTPGERIWSIDQQGQNLVCVLETLDGIQRRVVVELIDSLKDGFDNAVVVQQSAMPNKKLFDGARILSIRHQQAEQRLDLFTDRGRFLTYDLNRHGLTTASGTQLIDEAGIPVGPLRAIDSDYKKLIAVDARSRIVEAALPLHMDSTDKLQAKILFEPPEIGPPVNLEPVKVATEPDGIDLLMAEPGSSNGMPWQLVTSSSQDRLNVAGRKKRSLVEWVPLPVEKPLQIASLTRLQEGTRIGPQIATDLSGQLLWRDITGWKKIKNSLVGGNEILPAVGATFGRDAEGLKRIIFSDQGPIIRETLWTTPSPILRLPITAIAAVRGTVPQKSPVVLVVGHAGGLAEYDLTTRYWTSLLDATATNWTLSGIENDQGVCEHLWAIKIEQDKTISQAILVKDGKANVIANSLIAEARGAGDSLGLLFADGRLALATPDGVIKTLGHEKSSTVGDATLKRLALADQVYALDSTGRLLSAAKDTLQWRMEEPLKEGAPYRDLETTIDGALLLVTNNGQVLRHANGHTDKLDILAQHVERLDSAIAAVDQKSGRLEVLDPKGLRSETAAGGRNSSTQIGDHVVATLVDGDDLLIAGPSGAVWRDPKQRRCIPILSGDGIDRFEKLGAHRIAWKKTQPFLLTGGPAPKLLALGDPGTEVVLAPDATLWVSYTKNAVFRLKPVNGVDSGLFESESLLGEKLTQAASLSESQLLLQGKSGDLLIYETDNRHMRRLAKADELPSEWRFAIVSKQVFIISSSVNRQEPIYRIDVNPIALRLLEKNAMHVIEFSNGLAWLDDTGLLRHVDAEGKDRILIHLPIKQRTANAALQVTQILAGANDCLWILAGSTAYEYRVKEGSVVQKVSNVSELVRVGNHVAAFRKPPDAPNQLFGLEPKLNPLASAFGHGKAGLDSVLTWTNAAGTQHIDHFSTNLRTYRRNIAIPGRSRETTASQLAAADDRKLFCLTDQGAIFAYDIVEGAWSAIDRVNSWDSIGQIGAFVIASRRVTATESEVIALKPDGQINARWKLPGSVWFMDDGFVSLIRGQDSVRVVKQSLDGSMETLSRFDRLSAPFLPENSFFIESKALNCALICTDDAKKRKPECFVVRTDGSIARLGQITMPLLQRLRVFAQDGEFLFLDATNCLVRVAAKSGVEIVGTESFEEIGLLGTEVVVVKRTANPEARLSIIRIRDGKQIESLLGDGERASFSEVKQLAFVTHRTRNLLKISKKGAPERLLSLDDDKPHIKDAPTNELKEQTAQLPLQIGRAKERTLSLPNLKRVLNDDGWFSDQVVTGFAGKDVNRDAQDTVPLKMLDEHIVMLTVKSRISASPPEGLGGFAIVEGELRSKDNQIRFGRFAIGATTFACDVWADGRPFGKEDFFTLDSLGQLWRWTDSNGTLIRKFTELPSSIRTSLPQRLSLAAEETGGLVLLDDKNVTLARITPDGNVVADKNVVPITSPAQRSGRLGPIAWAQTAEKVKGNSSLALSLLVKDGDANSTMPISMTDSGLDADSPIGLKAIDGEKLPWLHLGRAADGREVVCPPIAEARLLQARQVSKFAPTPGPSEFTIGSFHFVPRDNGWDMLIDGSRINLVSGRLAIDSIRGAVTVNSPDGMELFLATAQPLTLVRQPWGRDMALGIPKLLTTPGEIRSLRDWRGELVVQTMDSAWHVFRGGQWIATAPEWETAVGGQSRWAFTSANGVLNWADQQISLLNDKEGYALASDVVSNAAEPDGAPMVRQGPAGTVIFASVSGDWLSWRPGDIVAIPVVDLPPRVLTELPVADIRMPHRAGDDGAYKLTLDANSSATFPMKLVEGRLPHHQVDTISSWGKDGMQVNLASNHGNWTFDGPSLRAGEPPQFSTTPVVSPIPPPDYDRHVAVELRKDRWLRWTLQDQTWQLQFAVAKYGESADFSLGALIETGLSIDDPDDVRPLELRDGRLKFAFGDQLWSRALGNALAEFKHDGELPFGSKTAMGVDPQTRQFALLENEATASLSEPALGLFSLDGQFDGAASATASVEQKGSILTLRLQQQGLAPLDLVVTRDAARWSIPFENPRCVLESDQRLLVLDDQGTSLGVWGRNGHLFGISRTPASITALWRDGKQVFARLAVIDEASVFELRVPNDGPPNFVPVKLPENEFAVTTDTFAVRRSLGDGHFDVIWRAAGEGDWQEYPSWPIFGFPGSHVDSALWLSDDVLACQDSLGIRRLDLVQKRYSPLHRPLSVTDRPTLIRHAGQLIFRQAGSQLVVGAESNPEGLRFTPSGESSGHQRIADWQVNQPERDRPVSLQATGSKDRSILLGDATLTGPKTNGSLLVDRVQLLANIKSRLALILPAGVQWLNEDEAFLAADEEMRSILTNSNLRVLSSASGELAFISQQTGGKAICLDESLRLCPIAPDAVENLYTGKKDGWRVFRSHDRRLVLERTVIGIEGPQLDRIDGEDILSDGGQFTFDRVLSVANELQESRELLISTERAVEIVQFTPNGPVMKVRQLGKTLPQKSNGRASLPIALSGQGKSQLQLADDLLNIPPEDNSRPRSNNAFGNNQDRWLPYSFQVDHRAWVVHESGIHWVETGNRWSGRRRELKAAR